MKINPPMYRPIVVDLRQEPDMARKLRLGVQEPKNGIVVVYQNPTVREALSQLRSGVSLLCRACCSGLRQYCARINRGHNALYRCYGIDAKFENRSE